MARQVMLSKMKVFIACVVTSIIFTLVWALFMALLAFVLPWWEDNLIFILSPLFWEIFSHKKRTFLLKCRNVLAKAVICQ